MAYIETIAPDQAEGRLKEVYDDITDKRGKIAEIHSIQSLSPEALVKHMELYMELMFGKSPLKRAQREMIGVVVSSVNECEYCQLHHAEALNHYWKDQEQTRMLCRNFRMVDLADIDLALCNYAEVLTRRPFEVEDILHIQPMREAGLSDRAILDAAQITAYFNFVNRLVLGLGAEHSPEEVKGYNY